MKAIRSHLMPLAGLIVLLGLTLASSYLRLGVGNLIVTLTISTLKMLVVACFFMELRKPGILFRLAAVAALLWLTIFLMLILTDYGTRFPGNLLE
jgi:caa(3)-type oxidase subunit IV